MRFKLDENLPLLVGQVLLARGHDVHTVSDEGLAGAADAAVMQACVAEDRILLTLDLDFADIRRDPPDSHPGIWILRPPKQTWSAIQAAMLAGLSLSAIEPVRGRLWVIDDKRVHIRDGEG